MLAAGVERLASVWTEVSSRFPAHFELMGEPMQRALEVPAGLIPLAPDAAKYYSLEQQGSLFVVVLRDSGKICGYWFCFCGPSLHYSTTVMGDMDIWFLDEAYREGVASLVLGRAVKAELERRGAKLWFAAEKLHRPAGRLYAALGMLPVEQRWAMRLGAKR